MHPAPDGLADTAKHRRRACGLWPGLVLFACFAAAASAAVTPKAGQPLPRWQRGMLDIHQINTGTGDAAFFIFPDGTTMLLDAAGVNRAASRPANYDTPPLPNA